MIIYESISSNRKKRYSREKDIDDGCDQYTNGFLYIFNMYYIIIF